MEKANQRLGNSRLSQMSRIKLALFCHDEENSRNVKTASLWKDRHLVDLRL